MVRPRLIAFGFLSLLLLQPATGLAQTMASSSSGIVSGSGASVPAESAVITEDRAFRLHGFAESLDASKLADAQYRERRSTYFRKRAEYRSACRDDVRRSNKNTLVKTLLRCYGSELSWQKDFLGKLNGYLHETAGLTAAVRANAVNRTELDVAAIDTVLFAMNSGVYVTGDDLLEAKKNLYQKYSLPLWDALDMVRADRALTWIALLIGKIDDLRAQELAANRDRPELRDARACLTAQETQLRALLQPNAQDRAAALSPALTGLQDCLGKIQGISRLLSASGSILPGQ